MVDDRKKLPDFTPDTEDDPTTELEILGVGKQHDKETDLDLLQARLNEKTLQLATLEKEARIFYDTVESGKNIIEALQSKVEQQQTTIRIAGKNKAKGQRVAEMEGCIAGNVQEINALLKQIKRTESYADELRARLQDISAMPGNEFRHIRQLEKSMAESMNQIRTLENQLENEILNVNDLKQKNAQMRGEFEQKIRRIRVELDTAE